MLQPQDAIAPLLPMLLRVAAVHVLRLRVSVAEGDRLAHGECLQNPLLEASMAAVAEVPELVRALQPGHRIPHDAKASAPRLRQPCSDALVVLGRRVEILACLREPRRPRQPSYEAEVEQRHVLAVVFCRLGGGFVGQLGAVRHVKQMPRGLVGEELAPGGQVQVRLHDRVVGAMALRQLQVDAVDAGPAGAGVVDELEAPAALLLRVLRIADGVLLRQVNGADDRNVDRDKRECDRRHAAYSAEGRQGGGVR
mmetsp:Transcript_141985/g.441478  ORF Transcript_141985/g.441478 Transcript_141985/m.441478 type:complete len:253 (+) Transcript_141985:466-1224(+)